MNKTYYYACLEFDDGEIIKVIFPLREEAHNYITKHCCDESVVRSWTE